MAEQFSLKRYSTEDLKAGMVVGRSIYDESEKELVVEGTVLTNQLIFSILDRPIISVLVREARAVESMVDQHIMDEGYVRQYDCVMQEMRRIFQEARECGSVDVASIQKFVRSYFMEMVDGQKAINHVHNLFREDDYLLHHSINVAILVGVLGQWMRLKKSEVENLVLAGLLHDIGKTQIPLEILEKPGKLSPEEMRVARQHSAKGFDLVRYGVLREKADILYGILQHHERMDGSGYPAQLGGERISDFARILAIADIYDAMAANKVYAAKRSPFEIFGILADDMAQKLDTRFCVLFIKNVCHSLNGNWVELSNGKRAKIIYIDESRIQSLPVVQCEDDEFLDLNRSPDIKITKLLRNEEVLQGA